MNLTDQIAAMLADAEKATGAFKMPMSLRNAPERIAVDKFNVEARTRLPAALRALLTAVKVLQKAMTGYGDRFAAEMALDAIAKELGNGEEPT